MGHLTTSVTLSPSVTNAEKPSYAKDTQLVVEDTWLVYGQSDISKRTTTMLITTPSFSPSI